MPTFEKPSYVQTPSSRSSAGSELDTASKAVKITQELRRPRQEAPRLSRLQPPDPIDDERARRVLHERLASLLPDGSRLALAVTDNRFTMITVKRAKGPAYRVRLHHMFLDAPPEIEEAIARYVAMNDRVASRRLGDFIEANHTIIRRARPRQQLPITVHTRGKVYDLQEVFDSLNGRYFAGRIDARITWGTRTKRKRRNSIKMGSYAVEDRLIRIHPALDRQVVPVYFLEWIVYHEMLHQVHDIPTIGGRRQFHTAEFLAEERTFEHYWRARSWERRNLERILNF